MKVMTRNFAGKLSILLIALMLASLVPPIYAADQTVYNSIVISSFKNSIGGRSISAGTGEGIRVGAKGIILKGDKKIADYVVKQVNWGMSWIEISNLEPGYTIEVGDSAPIISNPEPEQKVKKKSSKSKYIWAAVALGAIALLASNGGGGGSSPGNASITLDYERIGDDTSREVTVKATVKDDKGNNVPDGTKVSFSTNAGTLNPKSANTVGGVATTTLTLSSSESFADVTANAMSKSAVTRVSFDVISISLTANPTNIRGLDKSGSTTTITAIVMKSGNVPVPDGTKVEFTTSHGMITPTATTSGGKATTTLTAVDGDYGSWDGRVKITATAGGLTKEEPALVIFSGAPEQANCVATISQPTLPGVDGHATITVQARDKNGNPVVNGTSIAATTTKGNVTSSSSTNNGTATFTLSTSSDPAHPTTAGPGTVTIKIPHGGSGDDVTLTVDFTVN